MPDPRQQTQRWYYVDPPDSVHANAEGEGVVSVGEATTHLRLDPNDETDLSLLIDAATDYAEDAMSIVLMPKTIVATFYDREPIILPRGPLIEVVGVADANGVSVAGYQTRTIGHQVELTITSNAPRPVSVTYRAGYADRDRIPASIRLAILAHVGTLYEARESTTDKPRMAVPHSLDAFYRLKARGTGVG